MVARALSSGTTWAWEKRERASVAKSRSLLANWAETRLFALRMAFAKIDPPPFFQAGVFWRLDHPLPSAGISPFTTFSSFRVESLRKKMGYNAVQREAVCKAIILR